MLHDWKAFENEISALLKTGGDSGDSGDERKKRNADSSLHVATSRQKVSPPENEWGQMRAASGDTLSLKFQPVAIGVPTVAIVPTKFAEGAKIASVAPEESLSAHSKSLKLPDGLPAAWRSGFAAFCIMPPPENFPGHRWQQAVQDGFAFLSIWGMDAVRLGWSATDLFGASLETPWARVGMLGLIPLLNGDAVVALDTDAVTIETRSGSRLRYRRHVANDGRICLWEIGGVE